LKKRYTEAKYKLWSDARSRDEITRSAVSKRKKRARNREKSHKPSAKTVKRRDILEQARIVAPKTLSSLKNPADLLDFLHQIEAKGRTRHLFVDMSEVTEITTEAVPILLALIQAMDSTRFRGNEPVDPMARQKLHDAGFYDHVKGIASRGRGLGKIRLESSNQRVKSDVAAEFMDFFGKSLYGGRRKHGPSYNLMIEAMGNTFDHASPHDSRKLPWWASVYYDEVRRRVCFSIVDRGVGIFKSASFVDRLRMWKGAALRGDGAKMEKLLSGMIPSRTREPNRGRGLPDALTHWKLGRISELVIISNFGYAKASAGEYRTLEAFSNPEMSLKRRVSGGD
jgi:hypothetical protein